jgi:biotin carboxylase
MPIAVRLDELLHQRIVRDPAFLAGDYTIKWLEEWLENNPPQLNS